MHLFTRAILFYWFISFRCIYFRESNAIDAGFNCKLPRNCRIDGVRYMENFLGIDSLYEKREGLVCDIDRHFTFQIDTDSPFHPGNIDSKSCEFSLNSVYENSEFQVELKWPKNVKDAFLDRKFNFSGMIKYFSYFRYDNISLMLINLNDIESNLI